MHKDSCYWSGKHCDKRCDCYDEQGQLCASYISSSDYWAKWEHKELKTLYDKLEACYQLALTLRDMDGNIVFWDVELNECAELIEKAQGNLGYLLNPPEYPED